MSEGPAGGNVKGALSHLPIRDHSTRPISSQRLYQQQVRLAYNKWSMCIQIFTTRGSTAPNNNQEDRHSARQHTTNGQRDRSSDTVAEKQWK